ncbi:MAG: HAMP domain-containing histidine kinase [Actinobacteria bacterium]|nr:HAMP domain-containing histidine kinase [Actinomycetota bacterium]
MDLERVLELAGWASTFAFVALAVIALRVYRRHGDAASKWLVVSFSVLTGGLLVSRSGLSDAVPALQVVVVLAILAFPYLLLQFTAAFVPLRPVLRVAPAVVFAVLAVWTFAVVPLPEDGRSAGDIAWLVSFLAFFGLTSLTVATRLWRAAEGEPTIARRRMRTLAIAAVLLSLGLLLAGVAAGRPGFGLVVQLTALVSTVLFGIAFLPPALLRASWRATEEDQLYRAALRLMATTSDAEVAEVLLPQVTRVVGGHGATLESVDGTLLGEFGDGTGTEPMDVTLTRTRLRVWVSPYTPFFGEDEAKLLLRLGLLADLALDRAALLAREQEARSETESVNAELEAFVYSASHDLKTPLVTILGFLDVLGDERASLSAEDTTFYLGRMRANARYMQELIGDLLELSRIGRVETTVEPVDLAEVLTEIEEGLGAVHPDVRLVVQDELPTVLANRTRTRQLFANLVENAARYGGRPDVTVRVGANASDAGCELRVVDDGVGVPEEHRERVFGVFERLSTDERGTGIGLAICRKIVAELGGDIRFVDGGDGGADVRITLPEELLVDRPGVRTGGGGD